MSLIIDSEPKFTVKTSIGSSIDISSSVNGEYIFGELGFSALLNAVEKIILGYEKHIGLSVNIAIDNLHIYLSFPKIQN